MVKTPAAGGKAARTRRTLLDASLAVVAETGELAGEAVADRVGVSTATFYAHFSTKDHALASCLEHCFADFAGRMATVEDIELLLREGLQETLRQVVATTIDVNDEYRSLLRLARGRVQASALLRDVSRTAERDAFTATRRFLALGQAAGRVRGDDVDGLTAGVREVLDGLDSWLHRAMPGVLHEQVPDLLTRYLTPEGPPS